MTWILIETLCPFESQIDGSSVEIKTKFHDYSMSFMPVLSDFHAGFLTRSSHGISMAFAKKMMGFPSDLVSFLTKLPSERHEEIRVTFFTGSFLLFCLCVTTIFVGRKINDDVSTLKF